MAADVLRPHDILHRPFSGADLHHGRRSNHAANPNTKSGRKQQPAARPADGKKQRERSPKPAKAVGGGNQPAAAVSARQVAILKRPEHSLSAAVTTAISKIYSNKRNEDVYAGSGFSNSPAPSSLPLPTFSGKKEMEGMVDQLATMGLRRMLRLE